MSRERITSRSNPLIARLRRLKSQRSTRREEGVFLCEGPKMLREALRWDARLETVVCTQETDLPDLPVSVRVVEVPKELLAAVADTQTPQGILTVLEQPVYDLTQLLEQPDPLFLMLENLQDPGNLGTMIRTGEGAGITGVIMNNQTVDIFNPKTIRATMGSIFRVPFVYVPDLAPVLEQMHAKGIHTYAAHLKGQEYYDSFSFREPTAFLIGNEGNGLSKEISDQAGQYLKIPMEGRVESLNASIAAALLMYEAHRQRSARL